MSTISEVTVDEDLDKFWETIIARLNEKTKWNLNAKNTASIDQIILRINPPKDETPEKHAKTKKVWTTTLMCIDRLGVFVQRFGAFAAQAASVVFGPANQCFNAINFVISAAQQYKEVFSKITVLMERVSVFLENLSMFMDNNDADVKLDKRLRKTVYRVLEHFLRIMSTTYDLTNSRTARIKLMATSFAFGEDDGIRGYLATLETLVSDFTGAQISVIVQDLSAAAKDIRSVDRKQDVLIEAAEKHSGILDELAAANAARTQQNQEKKDREVIKKTLGIEEAKTSWDRQAELWDSHITGTGQWLVEKSYFAKWSDAKAIAADVITLKAPSGYGKSHLSSIVVQQLQEKHRGDSKVVVAYYYLQRESSEKSSALNKILRTIIWQVARSNREYAKAAVTVCEGLDTSRTANLWKKLVTDLSKGVDLTLFLVLDGIDVLDRDSDNPDLIDVVKQIRSVSADQSSHLKVRTFITGTNEALDPINGSIESAVPEVNLEANAQDDEPTLNQMDLELFVADRLERAERVKGLDSQLKERIRKELAKGARGAYSRLIYLLDDLVNIQNTNQIENILQRANQSLNDIIADKISALNNTLSRDEIWEVNQLLDWLTTSLVPLNVAQCESILSLRGDGQSIGLEDRILRRYSEIFSLNDDKEVDHRAGVQEYLEKLSEPNATNAEAFRHTEVAIQAPEVSLVQKMLQAHFRHVFGDEDVYARFGFEDFFQNKLGDQALRIRLIPVDSGTKVAQGLLIAVCDKYNDETSTALLKYAYDWFVEHLDMVALSDVDPPVKQDMGRKLTRLLQEEALIESWWAPERMYLTGYFVYSDYSRTLIKTLHTWLKDAGVQKGLGDMPSERQWVIRMTSGDKPDFALYSNIAKVLARRWFESRLYEERRNAFSWLCGYIQCTKDKVPEEEDTVPADLIREIGSWAKEQLGNADLAGKWHGILAVTFQSYKLWGAAIQEYRSAIELRPAEWHLQMQMAEVLAEEEEYADAVVTMEELVNRHRDLVGTDETFTDAYYGRMLHDIGSWNFKRRDFAAAEKLYQQILDYGMEQQEMTDFTHRAVFQMLVVLNSQARYAASMTLLDRCVTRTNADGTVWIILIFQQYALDENFHSNLVMVAKRPGLLSQVRQKYEKVIATTPSNQLLQAYNLALRYYLARLLWQLGSPAEKDLALHLWEEVIHYDNIEQYEEYIAWLRVDAAQDLAPALLFKSRESGHLRLGDADSIEHVGRLKELTKIDYGQSALPSKDPRMLLARLYHLTGDDIRARDTVRHLMKKAFDETAAEAQGDGFYKIAMILQSIDDDDNAIAAWSQYVPILPEDEEDSADEENEGEEDDDEEEEERPEVANGTAAEQTSDEQAVAGAEREPQTTADSTDAQGTTAIPQINGNAPNDQPATSPKAVLKGALGNHCDGACGVNWTYADDIYACKDCIDVQFHPDCYHKLKAGELDVAICGAHHEHIHIPPFDEEAWRAAPKDVVIVGGKEMLRTEWIDGIKRQWEIDEASLRKHGEASRSIQRAWKAYKMLRAATQRRRK